MILMFDIGNTTVAISVARDNEILKTYRINTNLNKTADQYYLDIIRLIDNVKIKAVAISSVVPRVTEIINEVSIKYFNLEPLILKQGTKTGIKINTDNPREVGADLISDAAALLNDLNPTLIIDLGTAIKYIYVKNNTISGVIITPGIEVSIKALVGNTALLPQIEITVPKKVLGTNTIECMQSGVTYGVAAQVDGLVTRIRNEVKEDFNIIITGGLADVILPLLSEKVSYRKDLVFEGLLNIYKRNQK